MLYLIDLFCGGGGTTTGAMQNDNVEVIWCVNHDALAIKSHEANHPDCVHSIEDIRTLDLTEMKKLVDSIRLRDPNAIIGLWASLECTNFSKAKGGLPRDGDSRTLAHHLFRYVDFIDIDIVYIENVEEFMSWGPLDEKGKPISRRSGSDYIIWCNDMQSRGYNFDYKILNAADFGAYTSRKRYFAQFAKPEFLISWPEATHSKNPSTGTLFGSLEKWKPVKDVLNLDEHGISIFGRQRKNGENNDLSDKTYERIYHGLIKFVAGGKEAFLIKYNSFSQSGKYVPPSIDDPCPTISCQGRLGLITSQFLSQYYSGRPYDKNKSIESPSPTIKTIDGTSIITTEFVTTYHGNGANLHSIESPSPTIPTKDSASLIQAEKFVQRDFKKVTNQSLEVPAGTVLTNPKLNLVSAEYFIFNPQFSNIGNSIFKPCPTLIARMDKRPPSLIITEKGEPAIRIEPTDSKFMILIKEFMAIYGIVDVKMRMFLIKELKRIQGFPEDYILLGTQSDQKKFLGNAVEVNQSRVITAASANANLFLKQAI